MNLTKREISNLYKGSGIQYRSQNMWTNEIQDKPKEINKMNNDSKEIIDLGRQHGKNELAMDAVSNGESLKTFRERLLADVANDKPLGIMTGSDVRQQFSYARAVKGVVNGDLDGLEAEYHQEMTRKHGKLGDGKVYVDSRAMTGSNTSYTISSYAQQVAQDNKQIGLYQELGVRVDRVNDGKVIYPRESSAVSTALYDLNNTTQISLADPTTDSVTLEAKQLSGITVVARNLLAQESIGLEQYLMDSQMRSAARTLDTQIIAGNGSGANFTGAVNGAGNAETYSGSMAFADLLDAINKIQADGISVANCAFVFHPDQYKVFVNADRGTNTGSYVLMPELQNSGFMVGRVLGIPCFVHSGLTAGQAVLGDFSQSVLAFHGGSAHIEVDNFYDFQRGSIAVRYVEDCSFGLLNPNSFCSIKSA